MAKIHEAWKTGTMIQRITSPLSKEAIAARLRLTREALGMNQADWCRKVGIATNTWNMYETEQNRISLDMANKVANGIPGITLDWIYRGIEDTLRVSIADAIRDYRDQQNKKRA